MSCDVRRVCNRGVAPREDRCGVCGVCEWDVVPGEDFCGVCGVCERMPQPEGRVSVCWKRDQAACANS